MENIGRISWQAEARMGAEIAQIWQAEMVRWVSIDGNKDRQHLMDKLPKNKNAITWNTDNCVFSSGSSEFGVGVECGCESVCLQKPHTSHSLRIEPLKGFEPSTCWLRISCSTAELKWRVPTVSLRQIGCQDAYGSAQRYTRALNILCRIFLFPTFSIK